MNSGILLLIAGFLISYPATPLAKGFFKFEDCGKNGESVVSFENIVIKPDPVKMKGKVTVTVKINVTADIPMDATVRVHDYRLASLFGISFDIPIPCMKGKVGSCTYKVCEFLNLHKDRACPFFPKGQNCSCPVKSSYFQRDDVQVPMPDLGALLGLIVQGRYRTEIKLIHDKTKKELACIKIFIQLKS